MENNENNVNNINNNLDLKFPVSKDVSRANSSYI